MSPGSVPFPAAKWVSVQLVQVAREVGFPLLPSPLAARGKERETERERERERGEGEASAFQSGITDQE